MSAIATYKLDVCCGLVVPGLSLCATTTPVACLSQPSQLVDVVNSLFEAAGTAVELRQVVLMAP
jgi:hypothetical protein